MYNTVVLFVETPRKFITAKLLKTNLDIVLALFTRLNHRFSRLDTTAAFQATSASSNWVQDNSS